MLRTKITVVNKCYNYETFGERQKYNHFLGQSDVVTVIDTNRCQLPLSFLEFAFWMETFVSPLILCCTYTNTQNNNKQ